MIWRVRRSLSIVLLWATIVLVIVVQRQYLPASRQSDQQLHAELEESIYSAPQQYTSKEKSWLGFPILKTVIPGSIYYFSAIGILEDNSNTYLGIVVIGWEENLLEKDPDIICHYTYKDLDYISIHNATVKPVFTYTEGSVETFICPIEDQNNLPVRVALGLGNSRIETDENLLTIYYPTHQVEKLALCTKVAFGHLNPHKLIEWFEMQKILGVDQVVILVMNGLNEEALDVLHHYQNQGIAHLHPYQTRQKKQRFMWPAYLTESTAALAHCWYAMRGYTYASILDFDEFIVPEKKDSIKDLLKRLLEKMPNVGTFCFHQKVFPTDDRYPKNESYTDLGRHHLCSQIIVERAKNIYLNSRSVYLRSTHSVIRKGKFERLRVDYDDAIIYHYRNCPGYSDCSIEGLHYEDGLLPYLPMLESSLSTLRDENPDLFLR